MLDIELLTDFLKRKKEILCEFFISFHPGETIEEIYKEEEIIDNFETFKKKYFEERFDLIEKLEIDLFWKLKGYSLDYDYEVDYDHNLLGLKITSFLKSIPDLNPKSAFFIRICRSKRQNVIGNYRILPAFFKSVYALKPPERLYASKPACFKILTPR